MNHTQIRELEEELTPENCGEKLNLILEEASISPTELAKILAVPQSTISRIISNKNNPNRSRPRKDFMNRLRALQIIGHFKYSKDEGKERIAASAAAIKRLNIKGVVAGLTALGSIKWAAAALAFTIPVVGAGFLGYGIIKGLQKLCENNELSCKENKGELEIKSKK